MRLQDKVAIITGAGSGMGRATAILFAAEGAKVVIADWSTEGGEETAKAIRKAGGEATFVEVDVSKAADAEKMVKVAVEKYGKIDILYNNAGIEGPIARTADLSEEDWDRVVAVDLKGVFLGSKYAIPEMIRGGGGVIINTASTSALIATRNMPAYCAAKGGVVSLARTMAVEYARDNIRVNCICPGGTRTPMFYRGTKGRADLEEKFVRYVPMGKFGEPEDIAQAALFLASDESSRFITGTTLVVDGGQTIE